MVRAAHGQPGRRRLVALLGVGLLVRVALVPWAAFAYDIEAMRGWTRQLVAAPLPEFYAADLSVPPDHLPGDLWLLWGLGHGARLFAPGTDFGGDGYLAALKLVPIVADLLIGVLLFLIARRFIGEPRATLVAAAFMLNPAAIFLSAVWGQWDAVSMALALAALLLLLHGRLGVALPVLTLATLIKPQLLVLAPLYVLYAVRKARQGSSFGPRSWWGGVRRTLPGLVGGGIASLVVVTLVCLPFDVGLSGMGTRWTLVERLQFAAERYQITTYNAYNLWALPIGRAAAPLDSVEVLLGVSAAGVGLGLLTVAYAAAVAGTALLPRAEVALVWAALTTTLALFLLPTRVHERYLFPALVFAILLWGLVPSMRWAALGLSATLFVNLYLVFTAWQPPVFPYPASLHTATTVRAIALLNLALFAAVLFSGFVGIRGGRAAAGHRQEMHILSTSR